jgi:acyl-coenzyme A thioesterase PaaI-like protein
VHGGFVARAFDEVLGYVNALSDKGGMTGTLTIKYRSPTPLHTELFFEGEIVNIDGRTIFPVGKLHAGERLCAEAEGLFVSVGMEKFQDLLAERERLEAERAKAPS